MLPPPQQKKTKEQKERLPPHPPPKSVSLPPQGVSSPNKRRDAPPAPRETIPPESQPAAPLRRPEAPRLRLDGLLEVEEHRDAHARRHLKAHGGTSGLGNTSEATEATSGFVWVDFQGKLWQKMEKGSNPCPWMSMETKWKHWRTGANPSKNQLSLSGIQWTFKGPKHGGDKSTEPKP